MVSYETMRRWVNHFGPEILADLRKRRPKPHTTWHLDEVYLNIDGRLVYLWRAVDAEGEVLDVLVQTRLAHAFHFLFFSMTCICFANPSWTGLAIFVREMVPIASTAMRFWSAAFVYLETSRNVA